MLIKKMRCFGLLFGVSALVAVPAWGSETSQAVAPPNKEVQAFIESLGPMFTPSPQLMALEKSVSESLLNSLSSMGTPEQVQVLKNLLDFSLKSGEQLLDIYTRMEEIKRIIDGGVSGEEEEKLREEMSNLIKSYKEVMQKRRTAAVDFGAVPSEEVKEILELPIVKEMAASVENYVLSPFVKYTPTPQD